MATIGSIMKTNLVTAAPEESVATAAARMSKASVGAILVVEQGRLVGLFSEQDLLRRVVAAGRDPTWVKVGEVATPEVFSVRRDAHIRDCVKVLHERGFRHLPVVEDGRPVGILGARDLLTHVTRSIEGALDGDAYDRALARGADPYDHVGGSYAR